MFTENSIVDIVIARAGFTLQGTSFRAWCALNGIDPGYAHHVVTGKKKGPKALALRQRILVASKIKDAAANG